MVPTNDYSKKKFLVIDDFPEFRSSVKRMVESFGGKLIDTAANGEDATEKMRKTRYDIVLSDYNLGVDGKDGQQVLEEAKFKKLIKDSSIYIMLTAESTIKMVMGALEYEPDGYLTKPFNKEMLLNRLEKIAVKKEALAKIYKKLDRKKYDDAIELCNKEIDDESKFIMDCLRIKADIYLKNKDYDNALDAYDEALDIREVPWAILGLGKVLFYQEEYYEASERFQEIIDENQMCVEAYDWLAKCKQKLDEPLEAQSLLEEAVKLSPKAILRQQDLGVLAYENGNIQIAEKAFRNAVKLGKFSCYRRAEDSLNLVEALLVKLVPDAGISGKRAGNESIQVLKELTRKSGDDDLVCMKAHIFESEAYVGLKQPREAKTALVKAEKRYRELGDKAPVDTVIKLANSYLAVGEDEKAQNLTREIIKNNFEDESLHKAISELSEAAGIKEESRKLFASGKERLDDLNRQGVKFFQEGKLQEAVELFEQAIKEMPNNISVNLNAAQAIISYMEQHGKDSKLLNRSRKYLDRVKGIDKNDKRFGRYQELSRMHEDVVKSSK